jgi:bifunctional pyridoxal-dependent enzyme with beta-cystathionase and maltose regulon repressor activities
MLLLAWTTILFSPEGLQGISTLILRLTKTLKNVAAAVPFFLNFLLLTDYTPAKTMLTKISPLQQNWTEDGKVSHLAPKY